VKRSYWGVVLSLVAVFASGIGVGALGYHSYTVKTVAATTLNQPPKLTPQEWRQQYIQELRTRLELQDTQVSGLNAILDETRSRVHELKDRHKHEVDQMRADQQNKVRAMLDAKQLAEYEKFREERDRKMKAEQAAREQAEKARAGKAGN
jgi:hypothetical protein